jgi:hypothetical protein
MKPLRPVVSSRGPGRTPRSRKGLREELMVTGTPHGPRGNAACEEIFDRVSGPFGTSLHARLGGHG